MTVKSFSSGRNICMLEENIIARVVLVENCVLGRREAQRMAGIGPGIELRGIYVFHRQKKLH